MKLPAIQFYPGDWKKDVGVQSLSFHDRGVWFEILMLMHDSQQRGLLLLNGKPITDESLARVLGLDNQILTKALTNILDAGVVSRDEATGALMSRRMVKDENLRKVRTEAGSKGGNPNLLNQNQTTGDNQKSTPSSSSSSSSSSSDKKAGPEEDTDDGHSYPEGFTPMQYAMKLLERTCIAATFKLRELVADTIGALGRKEGMKPYLAAETLQKRVEAAQEQRETINTFWFTDGKWGAQKPTGGSNATGQGNPAIERQSVSRDNIRAAAERRYGISLGDADGSNAGVQAQPNASPGHSGIVAKGLGGDRGEVRDEDVRGRTLEGTP